METDVLDEVRDAPSHFSLSYRVIAKSCCCISVFSIFAPSLNLKVVQAESITSQHQYSQQITALKALDCLWSTAPFPEQSTFVWT